jgi:hypothetical protein
MGEGGAAEDDSDSAEDVKKEEPVSGPLVDESEPEGDKASTGSVEASHAMPKRKGKSDSDDLSVHLKLEGISNSDVAKAMTDEIKEAIASHLSLDKGAVLIGEAKVDPHKALHTEVYLPVKMLDANSGSASMGSFVNYIDSNALLEALYSKGAATTALTGISIEDPSWERKEKEGPVGAKNLPPQFHNGTAPPAASGASAASGPNSPRTTEKAQGATAIGEGDMGALSPDIQDMLPHKVGTNNEEDEDDVIGSAITVASKSPE